MQFFILGPLEARRDGQVLSLGTAKQRALLAVLLLRANEVVSRDLLVDDLWGERPPASAQHGLEAYVSRLRKVLHADGEQILLTRPPGYLLRVGFDELDLHRFQRLVEEGRRSLASGAPERAGDLLTEALGLWRGRPLADVEFEPFAQVETERLEELRLGAVEARIEADLLLGRHASVTAELESLVAQHPLRERLREQSMLALYRSGRQSEALQTYRDARTYLVEELGLEPGPSLRELQQAILEHSETLQLSQRRGSQVALAQPAFGSPSDAEAPPPSSEPTLPPASSRRRLLPVLLAGALVVVGLIAGIALTTGSGPTTTSSGPGISGSESRLSALRATTGKLLRVTALPGQPQAITTGAGSLWLADSSDQAVVRVDPTSGTVVDRLAFRDQPASVTSGGGAIWVASTLNKTIERIDPATEAVTQTIRPDAANAPALAFGQGGLWTTDTTDHALIELDATTGARERTLALDLRPTALAVGRQAIWVADYDSGTVGKVDPDLGQTVATVHVGNGPTALALGNGTLWVANSLDSTVSRIDATSGTVVATIPVGSDPVALTVAGGFVWVANEFSGSVSRIDPRRNEVIATIRVGGEPTAIAAAAGTVWVGGGATTSDHRGGTLTLIATNRFSSIDPAFQNMAGPNQFGKFAYDTLVTLESAAGPAGLRLVPDLALALPASTADGTTFAFRLRSGIRYSDGRLLRAGDFRRAIERLFRVDSQGANYFSGIIGAERCATHHRSCDLSRGIRTDDRTGTVVFRLRSPDPDFLFKLAAISYAAPIPPGTPDHDVGARAVPGTGPYRLVDWQGGEIRFVRNKFFREWSHAAQPDGNPDVIVWHFARSFAAEVKAVERGQADWIFGLLPSAALRQIEIQMPAQVHADPTFYVDFIPLNTHRPPFNDVRVRRALNYAIDRARIAHMYGGPAVATPLCQPLPPGLPGYRRYCPYTLAATAAGIWRAPDIARAKRLVAASGTQGEQIDVWGTTDNLGIPRELPAYIASVLRSLGYRTRLHLVPNASITYAMRRNFQLSVDGDWGPDYPAPSSILPQFFGCTGGYSNGYVCDPQLDRAMRRAETLQLSDPSRAAALWAQVDHTIADQAYWVPTVNPHPPELVSKRVQNFQYNPNWDFIADQVWLR